MGRASSAKKVARAARAGGRARSSTQRNFLFPLSVAVVLVLGVSLVLFTRSQKSAADTDHPLVNDNAGRGDHWHAAYGIYNCDAFLPPIQTQDDRFGIHTHSDGIIHVHPFQAVVAGKRARLSALADTVGMKLNDNEIDVPSGPALKNGADCGGKPATLKVAVWDSPDATTPTIVTQKFGDIRFLHDRMVLTIAFTPDGVDIPKPPSIPTLDNLTDVAASSPTTAPGVPIATGTTVPGETTLGGESATTAPAPGGATSAPPTSPPPTSSPPTSPSATPTT